MRCHRSRPKPECRSLGGHFWRIPRGKDGAVHGVSTLGESRLDAGRLRRNESDPESGGVWTWLTFAAPFLNPALVARQEQKAIEDKFTDGKSGDRRVDLDLFKQKFLIRIEE